MGRPRKSEARDVRELLLAEAERLIAKSGEQALRTKTVASAVGVTEPALFHYFGSREGLIEEAQARRFESSQIDLYKAFRDATMKCTSKQQFAGLVEHSLRSAFTAQRRPLRSARINIAGSAVFRPHLMTRLAKAQRDSLLPAIDAMEYAQERGWVPASLDCTTLVYWIMSQTTGRFFVEMATDDQTMRRWNDMMVRATMTEMGLTAARPAKTPRPASSKARQPKN